MEFYNRKDELNELERIFQLCQKSSHMTVISGRRRVGKSSLVAEFCKNKKHLSLFVEKKNIKILLEEYSALSKDFFKKGSTYIKLDEFFEMLFESSKDTSYVLFFDEFQNFLSIEPAAFSMLQKVYDKKKESSKLHIILVGSHVSLMKKIFTDQKEPLFGRATENIILKPLEFKAIMAILDDLKITSFEEKIKYYSFFGGIPKYYAVMDDQGLSGFPLEKSFDALFFEKFAILRNEAKDILILDFGPEYQNYFSIMEAVSLGINEMSKIADKTGINIKSISKYLQLLVNDFNYLEYKVPVTEQKPWKSKKGRYFIKDPFFKFWFRFIYKNMSYYESEENDKIKDIIKSQFESYVGKTFEPICIEILKQTKSFSKIGQWWSRKGDEIDIIGLNDESEEILFAECKWQNNVDAEKILSKLKEKTKYVDWKSEKRKESYAIFAKSFKNKDAEGVKLYDLKDIEKIIN